MEISEEQSQKLASIVEKSDSWEELENSLIENNVLRLEDNDRVMLRNSRNLYMFVAGNYSQWNPRERFPKPIDLPGTVIQKDGITYVLHGIEHRPDHRQLLKVLSKVPLVVGESGMDKLYKHSNCVVQPFADEVKYLDTSTLRAGEWSILRPYLKVHRSLLNLFMHLSSPLFFPLVSIANILEPKTGQVDVNGTFWYRHSKYTHANSSIEQFNLPSDLERTYYHTVLKRGGENKAVLLRSLSQAEFFKDTTKERGKKEAHWLGGLFHEPQIAFFLRHPEFSNEINELYPKQQERFYISLIGIYNFLMGTGIGAAYLGVAAKSVERLSQTNMGKAFLAYVIAGGLIYTGLGLYNLRPRKVSTK